MNADRAEQFVGIEVSKYSLEVASRPADERGVVSNDTPGVARLVRGLARLCPARIVLEATGGLEGLVVAALGVAGLPVGVVDPRQVRDFARATGMLAKTDRLDAQVLAQFAQALQPPLRPLTAAQSHALLARRRQPPGHAHRRAPSPRQRLRGGSARTSGRT